MLIKMTKLLKQHRLFLFICFLFFVLRLPSIFEPYWYGDEGVYLTLGQGIRKGLILYRQIHDNKPPTLYYLAALGQSVSGFRFILFLWMIPTIYVFYRFSKNKLATLLFLVLGSVPLIEGNIANAEIFMLLPTILSVFLFLSQKYFLAGLSLGFAFTFKVPVVAELGFLCLWLLVFNFKKPKLLFTYYVLLITGFLLPIALWTVYFYLKGALPQFLFAALLQNFGYLSSWTTGTHSGFATGGGLMTRAFFLLLSWFFLYFFHRRKFLNRHTLFLLAWLAAAFFGALLSARPYPHYLIQVLPPLCLLLSLSLQDRRLLLVPLVLFLLILRYKFYFYPTLSYYSNFYSYIVNLKSEASYRSFFGNNVNQTYDIANYIKKNSQKSDRIFIWGDEPYIYALSNRLPASRYTVAYHIIDFHAYSESLDQLKTYLPKIIVYYSMANRPFPTLNRFINRYYYPSSQIDSTVIYQLQN